jgi:PAS domain S-box-containing protein
MDLRSDATFSDFFDQAAVALHLVGPDGIILHANDAELQLLGYRREEYVGHHVAEFHADDAVITDILGRLARGETLREYEARLRAKDGSIKHVLITSNVRRGPEGQFVHTRCLTRDITELRRLDADRRATDARFEMLARVAPVGLFRTDARGHCLYVNERWSEITGLTAEQAVGTGWSATLHPDDRERVFEAWYQVTKQGSEFVAEYRFLRPNGEVRWVVGRGLPELCDGMVVGYVGSVADVTRRKLGEFERERLLEEERAARAAADEARAESEPVGPDEGSDSRGAGTTRGHYRHLRRRDREQKSGRHYPVVEPRRRADVWLEVGGGRRPPHHADHPGGALG